MFLFPFRTWPKGTSFGVSS